MKSNLNIPKIKRDNPNSKDRYKRFKEPSVILEIYDTYFGEGYELYEHNYKLLITKDLGQCYRVHADYLNKYVSEKYLRVIEQQYI